MTDIIYNSLISTSIYQQIILATLITAFLVEIFYYIYFYASPLRKKKKTENTPFDNSNIGVSVIICAKNEYTNLETFLPLVLEQNYPNYEVIVVNDGSFDNSDQLLYDLKKKYPQLYITTIPQNSRVTSHKKLALTVGIKAAKNDILMFTDADCRPLTPNWISETVKQFTPKTEYVLSYGGYYTDKTIVSRFISYDTLFIAMQYFGFARRGIPYMGVGRNIAYRKSTFLKNKGFAGFLHIPSGDDDLIVNSFGTKQNTRIQQNSTTKTLSIPEPSFGSWFHQKKRHLGTVGSYTKKSKLLIALEPFARGLMYLSIILACTPPFNPALIAIAATTFIIKFILQISILNSVAKRLNERRFYLSTIIYDITIPLTTLYLMLTRKLFNKKNKYKW